jgi:hypothetical protein
MPRDRRPGAEPRQGGSGTLRPAPTWWTLSGVDREGTITLLSVILAGIPQLNGAACVGRHPGRCGCGGWISTTESNGSVPPPRTPSPQRSGSNTFRRTCLIARPARDVAMPNLTNSSCSVSVRAVRMISGRRPAVDCVSTWQGGGQRSSDHLEWAVGSRSVHHL